MIDLHWYPRDQNWRARLIELRRDSQSPIEAIWREAVSLACSSCDFVQTNALDRVVSEHVAKAGPTSIPGKVVRLAVLASSTVNHLFGAIRIGGLRRNLWIEIYENGYGQFRQELADTDSGLHRFKPDYVLFALDSHYLAAECSVPLNRGEAAAATNEQLAEITDLWRTARATFGSSIIHQTCLPVHPPVLGLNEHRLPGSSAQRILDLNNGLRSCADSSGADLLALDTMAVRDGIDAWHDASLWHRAKQEIAPKAAPLYGDLVARLIAARRGGSRKCLVLDLDNTIWGGVIGDDGIDGIELGQGSALGEGYSALQSYVRNLGRRGIILAVCSKNTEAIAVQAFESHPEMVLKRSDIACFLANWLDKPTNLKTIAETLNIGLDSLVLLDDNPAERALVRQALPMVEVPEITDDPIVMIRVLADSGFFESAVITEDDLARTEQYQVRQARAALQASSTDITSFLSDLQMRLLWQRFDSVGLKRIVQLINKTNQFNVRTCRYSEEEIAAMMSSSTAIGLQLRLVDRFGDNGVIAICIGKLHRDDTLFIDTWLMSCRVLGRRVEQATLNVLAEQARAIGAKRMIGEFIPTKKNHIVKDLFQRLGFKHLEDHPDGRSRALLDLENYVAIATPIAISEVR